MSPRTLSTWTPRAWISRERLWPFRGIFSVFLELSLQRVAGRRSRSVLVVSKPLCDQKDEKSPWRLFRTARRRSAQKQAPRSALQSSYTLTHTRPPYPAPLCTKSKRRRVCTLAQYLYDTDGVWTRQSQVETAKSVVHASRVSTRFLALVVIGSLRLKRLWACVGSQRQGPSSAHTYHVSHSS